MSLYEVLGLTNKADTQEIRRAYLKLSKTEHPDKGGTADKFKRIQEAYEILSDGDTRAFYDQTGQIPGAESQGQHDGMSHGMPFNFPFNMSGMFGNMFGGGMSRQQVRKQQKGPPKIHEIGLSLHNFYYGKKIEINFVRQVFCSKCKGEGAESLDRCGQCNGSGTREVHMMIGPGMAAVSRGPCSQCNGNGKCKVGICTECNGVKFHNKEKSLTVMIEPGMLPGDVLKFPNECSESHMYEEPGDVHIVLREGDESGTLLRIENTLHANHNISLSEALLGTHCVLQGHPAYPNGIKVDIPAGTMNGDTVIVEGEGMPFRGTTRKGNLHVSMSVEVKESEKKALLKNSELIASLFS